MGFDASGTFVNARTRKWLALERACKLNAPEGRGYCFLVCDELTYISTKTLIIILIEAESQRVKKTAIVLGRVNDDDFFKGVADSISLGLYIVLHRASVSLFVFLF